VRNVRATRDGQWCAEVVLERDFEFGSGLCDAEEGMGGSRDRRPCSESYNHTATGFTPLTSTT
jgi:hypothetical protein